MPENTNIVWILNEIFWDQNKKPMDDLSIMHELVKDFYIYGRHVDADFSSKDINVSRRHFQLRIENQQLLIKDLNSSNGVYVNGQKLTPGQEYLLSPNDKIGIYLQDRPFEKFIVLQKRQVEPDIIDLSDDDYASSGSTIPVRRGAHLPITHQLLERSRQTSRERKTEDSVKEEPDTTCPEPIATMRHKSIPKLRPSVNTNVVDIVISDSDDDDPQLREIIRNFDEKCRDIYQDDDDQSDVKHFPFKTENATHPNQPSFNNQSQRSNQPLPQPSTHHENLPSVVDRTITETFEPTSMTTEQITREIDDLLGTTSTVDPHPPVEQRQYCPKLIISRRDASVLDKNNCNSSYRIINSLPDDAEQPPKFKHPQNSRTSTKENCFTNIGQELRSTITACGRSKKFSSRATIADDDDLHPKSANIEEELLRTKSTAVRHCKIISLEDDSSHSGGGSKNINDQLPKSRQRFSSRSTVADDYDLHSKSIKSKWNSTVGRHLKTTLADHSPNFEVESKIIGDQGRKSRQRLSSRANVADNHDLHDSLNLGGESKTNDNQHSKSSAPVVNDIDSRTSSQELENKSNIKHPKCISRKQQNSVNHPVLPTSSDDDQRKSRNSSVGSGKRKISSRLTHYSDDEDYVPRSPLVLDNITKVNGPRRSPRVSTSKSIPDIFEFLDSDHESNAGGNLPKSRKSKKKTSEVGYADDESSPKSSQTNIQVPAPRKSSRCSSRKSYVELNDQDDDTDDEIRNKSVSKTNKTSRKKKINLPSKPDDQNLNKKTDDIDEEILKKSKAKSKKIKSQLETKELLDNQNLNEKPSTSLHTNQNSNERTTSKEINEFDHQISKKSVSTEPRRSSRCSSKRNYLDFDNWGDDDISDDILLQSVDKTYKTSKKKEIKSLAKKNKPDDQNSNKKSSDDIDKEILNKFTSKTNVTKPLLEKQHKDQNLNEKSSISINHQISEKSKTTINNHHLNHQVLENASDKNKNRNKAKEPERSEHRSRSKQNRDHQHDPEKSKSTKDNDQRSSRHHSTSKSRKETKTDKCSTHNAKSDESNPSKSRSHKSKESKISKETKITEGSSKKLKEIKKETDDGSNPSKSTSDKSKESEIETGSSKRSNKKNDESLNKTDNNQDKNDEQVDECLLDLTNIKREPVFQYTEQDIIEISDDESQLFNEQQLDNVDQPANNNQDDERYDDIYDNLTSDEEPSEDETYNKNWFMKLSQSQDITASKVLKEKKFNILKLDDNDLIFNEISAKTIEPVEEVDNEVEMHNEPTEINNELPSPIPSEINNELPSPIPSEINNELPSPIPSEINNELPSPVPTEQQPVESVKEVEKKKYIIPPVIEAPFLHRGKRKAPEPTVIPAKRDRGSAPTTDEHQPIVRTTRSTSSVFQKEFQKRNKKRRNSITDTISGDTKKEMQEARRLKLKEISTKQLETKKDEPVAKIYAKAKVKITDKTRGDFLTDETTNRPKRRVSTDERKVKIPKRNPIPLEPEPEPVPQSTDIVVPRKKTVSFNLEMNKVHLFDVEEELPDGGNSNGFQNRPCPTEYETFYTNVLIWNPVWLEQQKIIKEPPKVSNRLPTQMQYTFKDTLEYYNNVTPLMLLELWKSICQTWEQRPHQEVIMASIDKVRPYKFNISIIDCHIILTDNQTRYKFDDLLIVEIKLKNRKIAKKFGLIKHLESKRLLPPDIINPALINPRDPPTTLKYLVRLEMFITQFEGEVDNFVMKTRLITHLPPYLRLFKSVSNLHLSPLCKLILKPNVDDYKLPKMRQMTLSKHLTKQLDSWQTRCVVQSYEFCKRSEPGIYMIQGPPGTGKTLVIQNIILQLLFGQKDKSDIRILICTPSNAAIDDLVLKLLDLRRSVDKDRLKVVRLGQKDSMHPQVSRISVPDLAEIYQHRLLTEMKMSEAYTKNVNLHEDRINSFKKQMNDTNDMEKRDILQRKIKDEERELKNFERQQINKFADRDKSRSFRKAEETVICCANVICSTLSTCMNVKMEEICKKNKLKFTCCIIDESTQSGEQDNLLPLLLDIDKLILVGDKEQLPSTTLSQEAKMFGHGKSLFSRIQTNLDHHKDHPIQMLKTQYRMHPAICSYPNKTSYYGKLETAASVMNRPDSVLHPYRILSFQTNVNFKEEHINSLEVNVIKILCTIIREITDYTIGIITPYAKQRDLILHQLQPLDSKISVNTIDGFQGQERDVIIFSCVRFKPNKFLEDRQRLNVAITRAKYALFILAHSQLFRYPGDLTDLYNDAFHRQLVTVISDEYVNDKRFMTKIICRK